MSTMNRYPLPHYPLLTYSFLEYIQTIDLRDKHLVEFGAGPSFKFWTKRCKSVVSYEPNKEIYETLKKEYPDSTIQLLSISDLKQEKVINIINKV